MLNLTEVKMSKSLGNILTLRDVLDKYRPEALIAAFLGSHYRSPLEFSAELLAEAERRLTGCGTCSGRSPTQPRERRRKFPRGHAQPRPRVNPRPPQEWRTGPPLTVAERRFWSGWRRGQGLCRRSGRRPEHDLGRHVLCAAAVASKPRM